MMNIREPGKTYCDRCDRPITDKAPGHHKNTFNFHDVCPTPNSPDRNELRKAVESVLQNVEPGEVRVSQAGNPDRIVSTYALAVDDILALFDSFTAALQQTIEAEAITCDAQSVFPSEVVPLSTITKAFNEARGKGDSHND